MALRALGVPEDECAVERVNKVVGAMPLQGAAWEPMLAAANHYGMRASLTLPSTVRQLKEWTDEGKPVVIAWNPEGREWSHASLVFDVTEDDEHGFMVHVADPNIPDPDETVRVVPKKEFYSKWYEKAPQGYLIRRPACMIEREITPDGRQVMASRKKTARIVSDDIFGVESYEVAGTGSSPLTVTPIPDFSDESEYTGPGGVAVHWGRESHNMTRRQFAEFSKDMKDALSWASSHSNHMRMASRVASRHRKKALASERLDRGLRMKINADLERYGLDGNGRFRSPQEGYSRAAEVMQRHGVTVDGLVSSHLFTPRPSGTVRSDIEFISTSDDPFMPGTPISNSILYLQYHEVSEGRFEVVAYLS